MNHEFMEQYQQSYGWCGTPPDFSRCAGRVLDGRPGRSWQCSRRNGHGPHGAWCKQHNPEAEKARREQSYQKWRDESSAKARQSQFAKDCESAVRAIAAGHNDPRELAKSIIDKLEVAP